MSERLICTCDWPGDKECPRHPEKSLTQAADELGPIVKAWMREAYQEWPDDREVLIARKILASDWLAADRAAERARGAQAVLAAVEAVADGWETKARGLDWQSEQATTLMTCKDDILALKPDTR